MRTALPIALATLLVLSCTLETGDNGGVTMPPEIVVPSALISDAAHGGPVGGFYFLPPMVPEPVVDGVFDPTRDPEVRICGLAADGSACADPQENGFPIVFTSDGRGSERVRVDEDEEHYIVNFHTRRFPLDEAVLYRVAVFVEGDEFGFADLQFVSSGSDLKYVDSGQLVAVKYGRTLPIKFRIEEGAGPAGVEAVDDAYGTTTGTELTVPAPGLLANDVLGDPPGTIVSFGGGTLGGAVTDHAAGETVTVGADGSLRVDADGSLSFTPESDFTGTVTFEYRLENPDGTDDGLVTLNVSEGPTAVDDGPAENSVPGDDFHTALNTGLTATDGSSEDILENDELGFPEAALVSFGGGSLGGTVADHAVGSGPATGCGGDCTVDVNADGTFTFTPSNDIIGLFTFEYRIENPDGSSDATVTVAVGERATATADAVDVTGNIGINTAAIPFSVLDNDLGAGVAIAGVNTSATLGTVDVDQATGTFTYEPPAGFTGVDEFEYDVDNGFGPTTATVSLTVSGMLWFVDNTAAAGGVGTLSSPFDDLGAFNTLNGGGAAGDPEPGEAIFIYESGTPYAGPLTLLADQTVIGQDATLDLATLAGVTLAPGSDALPSMDPGNGTLTRLTSTADGIVLGADNGVHGLTIGDTDGPGIGGTTFGTLAVADVSITGAGPALDLTDGTVAAEFGELSSSGSATLGINLESVSGTLNHTSPASAVTAATGGALRVSGGTVTLTYNGAIANTAGHAVDIMNVAGGAITLNGPVTDMNGQGIRLVGNSVNVAFAQPTTVQNTSGSPAVEMAGHTAGSVTFAGLIVDNTGGAEAGLVTSANGPATLAIAGGSIRTGAGRALHLADTDLSVNLADVTTNGGIILNGNTGTLDVAGGTITGAGGSAVDIDGGSTIHVFTDVNVVHPGGVALTIDNAGGSVIFDGASTLTASGGDYGIRVVESSADVDLSSIGITNTVTSSDETRGANRFPVNDGTGDGIFLRGNTGSFTVQGGSIAGTGGDGIDLRNSSDLSLTGVTIDDVALAGPASGFSAAIRAVNSTGVNTVTGGAIRGFRTAPNPMGVLLLSADADAEWIFTGVTFDEHPGSSGAQAAAGIQVAAEGSASLDVTIDNSSFRNIFGHGVLVTANDVSWTGTHDINVRSSIFGPPPPGGGNGLQIDGLGAGTYDVEVTNNTFDGTGAGVSHTLAHGLTDNATFVGVIQGNLINPSAGIGLDIVVDHFASATLLIDDNEIRDTKQRGIRLRVKDEPTKVDASILNNRIFGFPNGLDRQGILLELEPLFAAPRIRVDNNLVISDVPFGSPALEVRVSDGAQASLHVTNNTLQSHPVGSASTMDIQLGPPGAASICLDLSGNETNPGPTGIELTNLLAPGAFLFAHGAPGILVTVPDVLALNAPGTTSAIVNGPIQFSGAPCEDPEVPVP